MVQARTPKQVQDELAALSKALYEKNFGAMVERINRALGQPSTKTFIGVLDIAGFEIFQVNGKFGSAPSCRIELISLFVSQALSSSAST